jgi:hypothetical protein
MHRGGHSYVLEKPKVLKLTPGELHALSFPTSSRYSGWNFMILFQSFVSICQAGSEQTCYCSLMPKKCNLTTFHDLHSSKLPIIEYSTNIHCLVNIF